MEPTVSSPAGRRWPWGIAIGLVIVILVNALFAWVAIRGADTIEPSYRTELR